MTTQEERNKAIIEEFRANDGKVGGTFANMSLLLLHTTGAKSHKPRVNPVAYIADGHRFVIIASKGGAPTHPDWYHNILANPVVRVEVGNEAFQARATAAQEPERSRLFARVTASMPVFAEYQRRTKRIIPVIVLERIG